MANCASSGLGGMFLYTALRSALKRDTPVRVPNFEAHLPIWDQVGGMVGVRVAQHVLIRPYSKSPNARFLPICATANRKAALSGESVKPGTRPSESKRCGRLGVCGGGGPHFCDLVRSLSPKGILKQIAG